MFLNFAENPFFVFKFMTLNYGSIFLDLYIVGLLHYEYLVKVILKITGFVKTLKSS